MTQRHSCGVAESRSLTIETTRMALLDSLAKEKEIWSSTLKLSCRLLMRYSANVPNVAFLPETRTLQQIDFYEKNGMVAS